MTLRQSSKNATQHTVIYNWGLFRDIEGNVTVTKLYTWEKFEIGYS